MDSAISDLEYVTGVLDLAQHAAVRNRLFWQVDSGTVVFGFTLQDAFRWSGKDTVAINPSDLPALRAAWTDLEALQEANPRSCALMDLPILYAARRRRTAPRRGWLVTHGLWHLDQDAWEPVRQLLVEVE